MDLNTIITLVSIIILLVILFVLVNIGKKKKEAKFLQSLYGLAEKTNCKLSEYERWNNSIIGIDAEGNYVFVVKKINDIESTQIINLADFQKCRVNESSRVVSTKESSTKVVDRIDLTLSNLDRNKQDTTIEYYNTAYDPLFIVRELQVAEKWSKIINDKILELARIK